MESNTRSSSSRNRYFIPGAGINRKVIQKDICRYLDNDATVQRAQHNGIDGYYVDAYRNLTNAMIEDLKRDSVAFEKEQRERERVRTAPLENYGDSNTHKRRWRDGGDSPGGPTGYGYDQTPAPRDRRPARRVSPQDDNEMDFEPTPGYPMASEDSKHSMRPPYPQEYPRYPQDVQDTYSQPMAPPLARGTAPPIVPGSSQTAPPATSRHAPPPTGPRYDVRDYPMAPPMDVRGDPRMDPRQMPREDMRVDRDAFRTSRPDVRMETPAGANTYMDPQMDSPVRDPYASGLRDARDPRASRDVRMDMRDSREPRVEQRQPYRNDPRDAYDPRAARDQRDIRDPRDYRDPREPRYAPMEQDPYPPVDTRQAPPQRGYGQRQEPPHSSRSYRR